MRSIRPRYASLVLLLVALALAISLYWQSAEWLVGWPAVTLLLAVSLSNFVVRLFTRDGHVRGYLPRIWGFLYKYLFFDSLRFGILRWISYSFIVGAVAVIRSPYDKHRFLLLRHHYPVDKVGEVWGLPGGALERYDEVGQDYDEIRGALQRELRQELRLDEVGWTARVGRLLAIDTSGRPRLDFYFESELSHAGYPVVVPLEKEFRPGSEVAGMSWCTLEQLPGEFSSRHRAVLFAIDANQQRNRDWPIFYPAPRAAAGVRSDGGGEEEVANAHALPYTIPMTAERDDSGHAQVNRIEIRHLASRADILALARDVARALEARGYRVPDQVGEFRSFFDQLAGTAGPAAVGLVLRDEGYARPFVDTYVCWSTPITFAGSQAEAMQAVEKMHARLAQALQPAMNCVLEWVDPSSTSSIHEFRRTLGSWAASATRSGSLLACADIAFPKDHSTSNPAAGLAHAS